MPDNDTAFGLCQCGCGTPTSIASRTRPDRGYVKGQPMTFSPGHKPVKSHLTCHCCKQSLPRSAFSVCVLKSGRRAGQPNGLNNTCDTCLVANESKRSEATQRLGPNPSGLCQCGCGQPAPIASKTRAHLGHVQGLPVRFIQSHVTRTVKKPTPHQIDPSKYTVDPVTGCWNWKRGKNASGYGILMSKGSSGLAHRVYYELAKGPVPDNRPLDHLCRNPGCVNPDHLEPVTYAINAQRGANSKLSMEEARAIRALRATMPVAEIAIRFNVSEGCIYQVLSNRTWRE